MYHTGEVVTTLAELAPTLLAQTTVVALDRPGPDTDATVADWRQRAPMLAVVAPTTVAIEGVRQVQPADLADAGAYARLISSVLRPGGVLVQDVHLSTVPCVPADRWWESIYLAATVRGMFGDRPPAVRFFSNKRGYTATFGRDLLEAGFDPRDVMDKSELATVVIPTVQSLLSKQFPLALADRLVADHETERRELESELDVLLWPTPRGPELSGRLVRGRVWLRPSSPETQTWLALLEDATTHHVGLPVIDVGIRLGGPDVERAEATNLAARHVHTMRSRLTSSSPIVTTDHAYRLADGVTAGVVHLR